MKRCYVVWLLFTKDLFALTDFIVCCYFLIIFVSILFVQNIVYSCHFIQERKAGMASIKVSRLHLVDLAGSERQKDTHAEGLRLKVSNAYELIFMIFIAYLLNACLRWKQLFLLAPRAPPGYVLPGEGRGFRRVNLCLPWILQAPNLLFLTFSLPLLRVVY